MTKMPIRNMVQSTALKKIKRVGFIATAAAWMLHCHPALALAQNVQETAPIFSTEPAQLNMHSIYGSGDFGRWIVDGFGLPAYRYDIDETTNPLAVSQFQHLGSRATHQVGNSNIKGMAFNDGYTQFWTQTRRAQWLNRFDAENRHFAGGFGYLNVDGHAVSMLYLDRPTGATAERIFGVGYFARQLRAIGLEIHETLYAPFGDDPVLLDEVSIHNVSARPLSGSWFEYWDVNPYDQRASYWDASPNNQRIQKYIGLQSPVWDAANQTLSVAQQPGSGDARPLSIFAAPVQGSIEAYETSVKAFFGDGTRDSPSEVRNDRLNNTIASPVSEGSSGDTLFALQSHFSVAPGKTITLRYIYGAAHTNQIPQIVDRYRKISDPLVKSERSWLNYLPKTDFGANFRWLSRELAWTSYELRSSAVYEESCGYHTITQGGYYQYVLGFNWGTRSWLENLLPMVYSDPQLAREILKYTVQLQSHRSGYQIQYGTQALCKPSQPFGDTDDLDVMLMLAAAEYGLGTRDKAFFDQSISFFDGGPSIPIWEHIKLAFHHQESFIGAHGDYKMFQSGDWADQNDRSLTESVMVTALVCYAYPRVAQLADMRGDVEFASQLRVASDRARRVLADEWSSRGWYAREYQGKVRIGDDVIFGEVQPWAILARVPNPAQETRLVSNIRRYLTGVNAPAFLHGPSRIGSTELPAKADPGIKAVCPAPLQFPSAACWIGGSWFDINGWLTWSLASLDKVVPNSSKYAWDEYLRNSLANHATQFPTRWDGITTVDDVCAEYYSADSSRCGLGASVPIFEWEGQNAEQPTWMVMNAINLAGISPSETGYDISPHFPLKYYSLRFSEVGLRVQPDAMRGYFHPLSDGAFQVRVRLPEGIAGGGRITTWEDGSQISHRVQGGWVRFTLHSHSDRSLTNWAISWSPKVSESMRWQ